MKKIYPWGVWFKRRSFLLVRGLHYSVRTYSMAQQVRNEAAARGLEVHVTQAKDDSQIQVEVISAAVAKKKRA